MVDALAPLRLATHHKEQNVHGRSHLHVNFGNHEFQFALQRLQLMKPVMGNFRGYISADGVLTMVMRGCAGHMVKM